LFNIAAGISLALLLVTLCFWLVTYPQGPPPPFIPTPPPMPTMFVPPPPTTLPAPPVPATTIKSEYVVSGGSFRIARVQTWNLGRIPQRTSFNTKEPVSIDIGCFQLRNTRREAFMLIAPGTLAPSVTKQYVNEWRLEGDFWLLSLVLAALPLAWPCFAARYRRVARDACPWCGYDLRATPDQCPECGKQIVRAIPVPVKEPPPPPTPPTPKPIGTAERMLLIRRIAGRGTSQSRR
jgi:hypothetical protein